MEEALIQTLLAHHAVQGAVATRVTPVVRPQASQLPALVLQRIAGQASYHMTGPDGLVSSRVQIDAWGARYADAKRAARAAQSALSGLRGTHYGVTFGGAFVSSENDSMESVEQDGTHRHYYRTRTDILVWHHGDA